MRTGNAVREAVFVPKLPQAFDSNAAQAEARKWYEGHLRRMRQVGFYSEECLITPAIADLLLRHNASNRTIREPIVAEYAAALRAGEWVLNGETLIIADSGELNDGQHRCHAILLTGIPMRTNVAFGVSRGSRTTTDTGRARKPGDHLQMEGVGSAHHIAAAVKVILNIKQKMNVRYGRRVPEIISGKDAYPDLHKSLPFGRRMNSQYRVSQSLCAALHYLFAEKNREQADEFFELLIAGDAPQGHPTRVLRSRLEKNVMAVAKLQTQDTAAIIIKGWNAYRQGRKVALIKWIQSGDSAEAFPDIL